MDQRKINSVRQFQSSSESGEVVDFSSSILGHLTDSLLIYIMQFLYLDEGVRLCSTTKLFQRVLIQADCVWRFQQIPLHLSSNNEKDNLLEFVHWVDKHRCLYLNEDINSTADIYNSDDFCSSNDNSLHLQLKVLFTSVMVQEKFYMTRAQNDLASCFALLLAEDDANDSDLEDFASYHNDDGGDY